MATKNNWVSPLAVIGLYASLSACSAVTTAPSGFPQMMGIEGATVVGTGKTITDHIVSFTTGKNCSTIRKNIGLHYCEEDEIAVPDNVFCYTTLGDITCYERPVPYSDNKRQVGQIPSGAGPSR